MTIKETFLTLGFSALILGFIFGVALIGVLVVNGMATESNSYIPEFQNCHISSDGHEMCK